MIVNDIGIDWSIATIANFKINQQNIVEMKWKKIPKDVEIGLNQELSLECEAIGYPEPTVEWIRHVSSKENNSNGN